MGNIRDFSWLKIIESICKNVEVSVCPLTNKYLLCRIDTEEEMEIPAKFFLEHRGTELAQIIYNFDHYGKEKAEEVLRHFKLKDTPLYKTLNKEDDE
jgi:hypothetical protein